MKRFLASALVLSSLSLVAFSGCEDKTEVKKTTEVTTPTGTATKTETEKVEATGDQKPAPTPEAPKTEEPAKTDLPK